MFADLVLELNGVTEQEAVILLTILERLRQVQVQSGQEAARARAEDVVSIILRASHQDAPSGARPSGQPQLSLVRGGLSFGERGG